MLVFNFKFFSLFFLNINVLGNKIVTSAQETARDDLRVHVNV